MFKIEIRDQGRIVKKKFYESVEQFNRWLPQHQKSYDHVYTVTGYRMEGGTWKECGIQLQT